MPHDLLLDETILLSAMALGFLGFVFADQMMNPKPIESLEINTNIGSLMSYMLIVTVTIAGYFLANLLVLAGGARLYPTGAPTYYIALFPLASLLCGAILGYAAILRATDAGKSRLFACLGLIPIANLVLLSAEPKQSANRPDYVPSNKFLRIFIGLSAAILMSSIRVGSERVYSEFAETKEADRVPTTAQVETAIRNNLAPLLKELPKRLDEVTILQAVDIRSDIKELSWKYAYEDGRVSDAELQQFAETDLKPKLLKSVCADPIVELGWTLRYQYRRPNLRLAAQYTITADDC